MKYIITGGAGFIGSNFIRRLLKSDSKILSEKIEIINIDNLTYAGNLENLTEIENERRYSFQKCDIADRAEINKVIDNSDFDILVNFAAESHVDRSIDDATPFINTNITGTVNLLDAVKRAADSRKVRYVQVSTDEVYGSLGADGKFTEDTPLDPRSPYSASKAAADCLVQSYFHTYGLDTVITRCSNNYGPYQFPEKLIPLMIINILNGKKLPVYGDGLNIRDWIHVEDHCRGIELASISGKAGEVYNFGGESEKTNIQIVQSLLDELGADKSLITYVKDRLGHDKRYAIDNTKSKSELGFKPTIDFESGIKNTVQWYLDNKDWWEKIISGEYKEYYRKHYYDR
jgi:dTDP-glucose 4,6-dehydratase